MCCHIYIKNIFIEIYIYIYMIFKYFRFYTCSAIISIEHFYARTYLNFFCYYRRTIEQILL